MKNKKEIFIDLISCLDETNIKISKKDLFLQNIEYIKKLLFSGLSTKRQVDKFCEEIDIISRSAYEKYCKEFLKEEYEKGLLNTLFLRNLKTIAYFITEEKNPKASELYKKLLENGSLKQFRNKKDSSIDYSTFINLLKEFLKDKGYEELIEYDNISNLNEENETNNKTEIKIENPNKIKIDLVDDTSEYCNLEFLKTNFIEFENSYIDNNIKEKNVYYIQARYIDKEYSFENFKKIVLENSLIENYSIIIHNNSTIDTKLYIYRYINNGLILLKTLDALSCVFELEELIRRGRENFFYKFEKYLNRIIT
ncbi:hypothetical protein CP965_01645 [Halarcobacter mediterraneus]|uniref:Uncharacterized protein n=1 Tax=Halarcobacter mediterraneus TaxID=2023153 RepID=A0A4Q1B4Z4_9BACT|nr:hypothetical protein [Halarcobacter mediterraneus]RXK14177.1 hypothetical protein CP965_01645 [Halarcobacter mediterraneus]